MFPSTRSGEFLAISLAYKGNLFSSTQIMNWPHKGGNYRLMLPFNGPPAWIAPNRDTHRNHKLNESEQWNRWTWTEWSGNVYCIFFFCQCLLSLFWAHLGQNSGKTQVTGHFQLRIADDIHFHRAIDIQFNLLQSSIITLHCHGCNWGTSHGTINDSTQTVV